MDRYQRVEKPREETPINENEIRITSQGRTRSYITYATSLLQVRASFFVSMDPNFAPNLVICENFIHALLVSRLVFGAIHTHIHIHI